MLVNYCIKKLAIWMCSSEAPEQYRRSLYVYGLWAYLLDYIFWKQPIPLQHVQFQKELCTFLNFD